MMHLLFWVPTVQYKYYYQLNRILATMLNQCPYTKCFIFTWNWIIDIEHVMIRVVQAGKWNLERSLKPWEITLFWSEAFLALIKIWFSSLHNPSHDSWLMKSETWDNHESWLKNNLLGHQIKLRSFIYIHLTRLLLAWL